MCTVNKIGLFGGTFDPIHVGHTAMAKAFADELNLDTVVFIPAGDPYHKDQPRTAARHRLAMVEAAIATEARFAASDCDIVRSGATYTFDTVSIFRQHFPPAELWWLMGSDSLLHLHTWHRFAALFDIVNFAIAQRGEDKLSALPAATQALVGDALAAAAEPGRHSGKMHLLRWPPQSISSTAIRQRLAQGADVRDSIAPAVAAYIARHHLYTESI